MDSSVSQFSPSPTTMPDSAVFWAIIASMRSSTVPGQRNLRTWTLRRCPMRNARSVAWFSTAGFHQRSRWTTWLAAVSVSPVPPALSESSMTGGPSPAWNRATISSRRFFGRAPVQERDVGVEPGRQVRHQQMPELGELREAQHPVALGQDLGEDLLEAHDLAGAPPDRGAVVQELGRVVADLLELGHRGEHVAPALDALRVLDLLHHVVDDRAVERGLLRREPVVLR